MSKLPTMKFKTPAGEAKWPAVEVPVLNFNEDGQEYKITLSLPAAKAQPMIDALSRFFEESLEYWEENATPKQRGKAGVRASDNCPWKNELDEDDNPTGNVLFNFKQRASITSKKDGKTYVFSVARFDSVGQPCTPDTPQIGGGSTVRVSAEARPYCLPKDGCGISLQLKSVFIKELVAKGGQESWDAEEEDDFVMDGDGTAPSGGGDDKDFE